MQSVLQCDDEWPFQEHLPSKAITNLKLCLLRDLNECAVASALAVKTGLFKDHTPTKVLN